jgi:hypothetical protein
VMPRRRRRATAIAVASVAFVATLLVSRSAIAPALTEHERMAAAVRAFGEARNRMTPDEVRELFGEPGEVFRNNPRALCWSYATPYEVRMCWGPKRKAAWIAHSVPLPSYYPDIGRQLMWNFTADCPAEADSS